MIRSTRLLLAVVGVVAGTAAATSPGSVHAQAPSVEDTDWIQIAALYTALLPIWASPSARIGHAVAIGMADGPDAGLARLDLLTDDGDDARLLAARGHLLQRAGRTHEATIAFETAAESARHPLEAERLRRRAHDTGNPG